VLEQARSAAGRDVMHRILALKKGIDERSEAMAEQMLALQAPLDSDEMMSAMCLSGAARGGKEAFEVLLDGWMHELGELLKQLRGMNEEIDSMEKLLLMNLASSQNRLIRAEVTFTMFEAWFSLGVVVFTFFGMNLHTGLEWDETGPWTPHTHSHKGPSWHFLSILLLNVVMVLGGAFLTWQFLLRIGLLIR